MSNEMKIDWASGRQIDLSKIDFIKPIPIKHTKSGGGLLPDRVEAYALWQFLICAFQAIDKIPTQTTLIGTEDRTADLMQIANSCRKLYELDSLEGMFNAFLVRTAQNEAKRSGLPWNTTIDTFFDSGGKRGAWFDRNPDKVGQ